MSFYLFVALCLASAAGWANADTPANCTYEDILGTWTFYEGERGGQSSIDCSQFTDPSQLKHQKTITLLFPDKATDELGNKGRWTLIYNQGFEIRIAERIYFAFSNYTGTMQQPVSYCGSTKNSGWAHDILIRDWSCFIGEKNDQNAKNPKMVKLLKSKKQLNEEEAVLNRLYKTDNEMIKRINTIQNSWRAAAYPEFEQFTVGDMVKRAGGRKSTSVRPNLPYKKVTTGSNRQVGEGLPKEFDWRNVNGQNFVSPVRNQEGCGSCYIFASMAMLEARLRILTNNTVQQVFSPQDVLECSEYSQACDGGFPYLIAGKYAEDFGVVNESSNPYDYTQRDQCKTPKDARRYYATDYHYVGGYYGGCDEPQMREALVRNGPIAIGFEVYDDFTHYKSGIYHHTFSTNKHIRTNRFNPFEITNHAVLIVGYGYDEPTSQPFWIVKNSWGADWGEQGFFRVRRGNDECAFESLAVEATPVTTF